MNYKEKSSSKINELNYQMKKTKEKSWKAGSWRE